MNDRTDPAGNREVGPGPEVDLQAGFPTNAVVGILDEPTELVRALDEIRASGYAPDVLCGPRGVERIEHPDAGGDVRVIRSVQHVFGFEAEHAERHQRAVEDGDFLVVVRASDDDEADRIGKILVSHGGEFVNHYTRWTGRSLAP